MTQYNRHLSVAGAGAQRHRPNPWFLSGSRSLQAGCMLMQSRTGKSCGGKRAIRCSCTQADLWMGIFGRTDCASPVPPSHPLLSHSLPDTDMDGDNELLRSRSKATWSGLFFSCQPFVLFPPTDSFALSFSLTRSLGSRTCGSADLLTTCCSLTICRPTVRE